MLRKFKVTYKAPLGFETTEIEAYSKYNAKKKFHLMYPKREIIKIEEVEE